MRNLNIVLVLVLGAVWADRPIRNENTCHSTQLDACLTPVQRLSDDPNPTIFVTNETKFDGFCRTIEDSFFGCITTFVAKCGTPAYKEISKVVFDHMLSHVREICAKDSSFRTELFENGKCLHEKVLSQKWFHRDCNPLFPRAPPIDVPLTQQIDVTCCGLRQWEDKCVIPSVRRECGESGVRVMRTLVRKATADLPDFMCKQSVKCVETKPNDKAMHFFPFFINLFKRDHKM